VWLGYAHDILQMYANSTTQVSADVRGVQHAKLRNLLIFARREEYIIYQPITTRFQVSFHLIQPRHRLSNSSIVPLSEMFARGAALLGYALSTPGRSHQYRMAASMLWNLK